MSITPTFKGDLFYFEIGLRGGGFTSFLIAKTQDGTLTPMPEYNYEITKREVSTEDRELLEKIDASLRKSNAPVRTWLRRRRMELMRR